MSVSASSPLLIYVLLSFYLLSFVTYSDIALGLLLNEFYYAYCCVFVFFSTLARDIGGVLISPKTCLTPTHFCACPKSETSGFC